jgi:TonB-linked SusC/RagA family outer membrane protein
MGLGIAQNQPVNGIVLDENGEGVIGALVVVKGTTNGAITDINGNFSLSVSSESAVLKVSYLGYKSVEISAGKDLKIKLEPSSFELEDVVVTGYQNLPRDRATGAYKILSADVLSKPGTNVGSRLIGATSGIQVNTDINGNVFFEIRGRTSITANAKPLIVVNGFPIEGDLSTLNPNDIESITILKDAAAASIWGAKSANGVISVTTRGGRLTTNRDETKVEFSSFVRFQPKVDLNYARSLASSLETIEYEKRAFDAWGSNMPQDGFDQMAHFTPTLTAMNEHRLGYMSEAEMNKILETYSQLDNSEQIKKYLLQNPLTQQYNLNIASSNSRSNNNISLLYEKNAYYMKGRSDWKGQMSYRNNTRLAKWLDFSFSGTFLYKEQKDNNVNLFNSSSLSALPPSVESYSATRNYTPLVPITSLAPYEMLVDANGNRTNLTNGWYFPNLNRHFVTGNFPYDFTYNPITELESRDLTGTTISAILQAGLTFKLMKGLTFDSKAQYELNNLLTKNIYTEKSYLVRQTINESCSYDRQTGKVTVNLPLGGFLDQARSRIDRWNWRNQLNFSRQFGDRHELIAIAGTEISDRTSQRVVHPRSYGYNDERLTTSGFPNGPGGSAANLRINDWVGSAKTFTYLHSFTCRTDRFFSLYGNASYTLDSKYTLSGSIRTDASNLIANDPKYRYSPFWSMGGSWQMAREDFLKDTKWIDMLTPRFTYGYNGNVDTSTSFMPLIGMSSSLNMYTWGYTASVSSYGNPTLRWEKTGTWNVAVDYSLFSGQLFGKIDFYNKRGKDLLATISIPAINGTTSQKLNNAEMVNRGFEFELGTIQNIAKDFAWRGSFNLSYNKNKITKFFAASYSGNALTGYGFIPGSYVATFDGATSTGSTVSTYQTPFVEGYDANTLWTYIYTGVRNLGSETSPNWQPTIQGPNGSYFDLGSWTSGDAREFCKAHGTMVAPWLVSLNNGFKYKNFDLSFIITGKFGHKFKRQSFNYPAVWKTGRVLPNNKLNEVLNADPMKMIPLPQNGTLEPKYYFWDRFYPYMDYLVENAGHIRFQEVSLSYVVPSKTIAQWGLEKIQLYAQANNLFSIYFNKYNEDPEYPAGTVKPTSAYTIGMKVSF